MRSTHCFVVFIALTVFGCVDSSVDPSEDVSDVEQDATTAFANDKPAYDYFIAKGLTNFQAAGIVGNLDQESGINPSSVQAGGPGRGIAQWSVGGRWDTTAGGNNVQAYAASQGKSATSLSLQLDFIWLELTKFSGYGLAQLKATTNVTDATIVFMSKYEICGNCVSTQRVSYAKSVLAAYGAINYGASYVSQSWPLASKPPMIIKCGERVAANIKLKNTGSKTWNSGTKLGTTGPRDRASIFAGADWLAPNRAAAISGTVAPGATGTFSFSFDAPTGDACKTGIVYEEFFGLVQEGSAWFSDNGDGGPADDQIEALIELAPADGTGSDGSGSDGTGSDGTGSDGTDDGGAGGGGGCDASGGGTGGFAGVMLAAFVIVGRRRRPAAA